MVACGPYLRRALRTIGICAGVGGAWLRADPTLANLSTLGPAGSGSSTLYGGFVVSGGTKTLLIRGVGPGLAPYGVTGLLADPQLTVFNASGQPVGANENWQLADGPLMSAVGAFALSPGSTDAALVTTLPAGAYTAQITGPGSPGAALFEIYDAGGSGQLINLSSRLALSSGGRATAGFVISPGSGTRTLLVRGIGPGLAGFGVMGTLAGTQLALIDASQTTLATASGNAMAANLVAASTQAGAFAASAGDSALVATVGPGAYTAQMSAASAGDAGAGLVEIYDVTGKVAPSVLYIARLQPAGALTASSGSGYATLLYDPLSHSVQVALHVSDLTSPETTAHLELAVPGSSPTMLLDLGSGSGTYDVSDLSSALAAGEVTVAVATATNPGGELAGTFAAAQGSSAFTAPATPPALPAALLNAPGAADAARFLQQATFGPTLADIAALSQRGIPGWLDDQMALAPTLHLTATRADAAAFPTPTAGLPADELYVAVNPVDREAAWWKIALTAPDQLRQRVAFALSELFVVSEQDTTLHPQAEALANYYDILVRDAFGNFRQLLGEVTLSPVMGTYLTYLRNQPASLAHNTSPDENYAREVQQLFTIGLLELRPDGTLALDANGLPIPTYDQAEITEVARVFTGWSFAGTGDFSTDPADTRPTGAANASGWLNPMTAFAAYHDTGVKTVLNGSVLPAGHSAEQDTGQFLDLLFQHPNTGPFLARRLIQRLVTSNPSPGYVYRVAQVFADDGTGTRGNLGAVVRAILTDYEARSPDLLASPSFGKIKEPLLRMTALFRALHAAAPNGRYLDSYYNDPRFGYTPGSLPALPEYFLGEGPLAAPTVFNFFSPDFVAPGPLAAAGLVAPEMQLADAHYSLNLANEISYYLYRTPSALTGPAGAPSPFLVLDPSDFAALAVNPGSLVDAVNLVCCGGQMSAATRQQILTALSALQPNTSAAEIAATALQLAVTSPDGARQK